MAREENKEEKKVADGGGFGVPILAQQPGCQSSTNGRGHEEDRIEEGWEWGDWVMRTVVSAEKLRVYNEDSSGGKKQDVRESKLHKNMITNPIL